MKKKYSLVCALAVVFVFSFFTAVNAQRLDLKIEGFGGISGGSTDDPEKSGELGFSGGGGLGLCYYFTKAGRFRLGAAAGLNYMYLTYKSETNTLALPLYGIPSTSLSSETYYTYLVVPVTLRGNFRFNKKVALNVETGPFFGFFQNGKSDSTYGTENPPILVNGENDLNEDTTEQRDIGIRFAASLELPLRKNLRIAPGILFDLGFTDTSKDQLIVASSKDTFWKLGAYVSLLHNLF